MFHFFRSSDGNTLVVASTDGFCSLIRFKPGELGQIYTDEAVTEACDSSMIEESIMEDDEEEDLDDDEMIMDEDVPVSKDGIPLNKEGVCSPAAIKIRSVKEGGRPNPKRLQLITISSPKSKNEQDIDENDLNLILEETVSDSLVASAEDNKKVAVAESQQVKASEQAEPKKKRVPFVTLSTSTSWWDMSMGFKIYNLEQFFYEIDQ